ncbi:SRPBCC family protein [Herbiconiux sp. CPCC 203386]|uniref:SRPBCC family protein n=1 Tax=Herbiconiux daphne TaxID=2970914 RepID=A0ABT2GWW3_9MICO|nr:SRPBCC family protein [Herbiconiux daphne]
MSTNVRHIRCTPEHLFEVLADGWLFPVWVVGASRMRDVNEAWPHVGSQLHHSFGVSPLLINDTTTVLEWNPPHRMVVQPAGWPLGETRVVIDVKARAEGCLVRLRELAVRGPGTFVPRGVMDVPMYIRNVETLKRLGYLPSIRR